MRVVRHEHPRELLAAAEGYLVEREVENTGILGAAYESLVEPAARGPSYVCSVHDGRHVVGVALLVSPERLAVSCASDAALEALARDAREALPALASVVGVEDVSRAFGHAWSREARCVLS